MSDRNWLMTAEADIVAALRREESLLRQLAEAVLAQRAGIAAADIPAVEDGTTAISRLILTLDDARRQRERIADELARNDADYEGTPPVRPTLVVARDAVRRCAERVARELAVNQRILGRAVKAGDAYLQALFSSVTAPNATYGAGTQNPARRQSGVVVNATA